MMCIHTTLKLNVLALFLLITILERYPFHLETYSKNTGCIDTVEVGKIS